MRLFVGVALPLALKKKIVPILSELVQFGGDLSVVPVENIHFTLKFLGDVDEKMIPRIISELEEIGQRHLAFSTQLYGLGVFPSKGFVRIVWAGIKEDKLFVSLIRDVQSGLEAVRTDEYKDPIPHLTLARVQSQHNKKRLLELVETYRNSSFGEFVVDCFALYRSVLGHDGPAYSELASFSLSKK